MWEGFVTLVLLCLTDKNSRIDEGDRMEHLLFPFDLDDQTRKINEPSISWCVIEDRDLLHFAPPSSPLRSVNQV